MGTGKPANPGRVTEPGGETLGHRAVLVTGSACWVAQRSGGMLNAAQRVTVHFISGRCGALPWL
jgi:hypothetical protein